MNQVVFEEDIPFRSFSELERKSAQYSDFRISEINK